MMVFPGHPQTRSVLQSETESALFLGQFDGRGVSQLEFGHCPVKRHKNIASPHTLCRRQQTLRFVTFQRQFHNRSKRVAFDRCPGFKTQIGFSALNGFQANAA